MCIWFIGPTARCRLMKHWKHWTRLWRREKVRFVGLSNFTLDEIKQCMAIRRIDVLQYDCNLFDRRMARWIFPYAEEQGIGVMTYASLAYGLLSGAFTEATRFEDDWRGNGGDDMSLKLFLPGIFQRNVQAANKVKAIAQRLGKNLPHLALRWVWSNPGLAFRSLVQDAPPRLRTIWVRLDGN